jgi:hypothetical protein
MTKEQAKRILRQVWGTGERRLLAVEENELDSLRESPEETNLEIVARIAKMDVIRFDKYCLNSIEYILDNTKDVAH